MTRAVGYIRVSTREQADEGVSLAMQTRRIAAECQERGWELVEVYADAGYSGMAIDRPGLQRLLSALETDAIDALVVWKLDRLGRRSWWRDHLIEEVLLPRGIQFSSITERFDPGTAHGRLLLGMLGRTAQYERDLISERTAEGLREVSAQGRWSGRPPYGYRLQEGALVVHPQEAAVVREAFRLYLEGMSMPAVARQLARLSGRLWRTQDVWRVLHRRTYIGEVKHGAPGQHEPIVDPTTFQQAQEIVATRRAAGGERRRYLFSRILRCCHCGSPMVGRSACQTRRRASGAVTRTICRGYTCSTRNSIGLHACRGQFLAERKATRLLVDALRELSKQADLGPVQTVPAREQDRSLAINLRQQLAGVPARRRRVVDLAARALISDQDLEAQLAALERERADGERSLQQMEREYRPSKRRLRGLFRDLGAVLESEEPLERKRRLVEGMLAAVVIDRQGNVNLTLRYVPSDH